MYWLRFKLLCEPEVFCVLNKAILEQEKVAELFCRCIQVCEGVMDDTMLNNSIYQYLKKRNSHFAAMIVKTYDFADDLLKEVPKDFSNYTLHDITHATRVVNYMTCFVENDLDSYSDLHLTLIILSGLMHDTGMVIPTNEMEELEKKYAEKPVGELKKDEWEKVHELIKSFVRENHGERVKKVIEEYNYGDSHTTVKSIFTVGKAYNISDDIALICHSHQKSCEWIKENISSYRSVAEYEYNPQQIALLLRIGDALDIDDRRAPPFLAELLSVKGRSEEEWKKHHPITNYDKVKFEDDTYHMSFDGKCNDAYIFRQVQEYISWCEGDWKTVNSILKTYSAPYNIRLNDEVQNTIQPVGFEATDLRFTLEYEKVIKLLAGENLYGDKRLGLRELLQNAVDAVLVMKEKAPADPLNTYVPTVCIELDEKGGKVVIHDNGIGMTEEVLRNYFFNLGQSYYTSPKFLENNYKYSPIGHFGIGFLSCFMLSDSVSLFTKSAESNAIYIEFEKTSKYVTQKKVENSVIPGGHGTKVFLDYKEVMTVFESEGRLIKYVENLLLTDGFELKILRNELPEPISIENLFETGDGKSLSTDKYDVKYNITEKPEIIDSVGKLLAWLPTCDTVLIPVKCGENGSEIIINLYDLWSAMNCEDAIEEQTIKRALNYYNSKRSNKSTLDEVILDEICVTNGGGGALHFSRYYYYLSEEKLNDFYACEDKKRFDFARATAEVFIWIGRELNDQDYLMIVDQLIGKEKGNAKYDVEQIDIEWFSYSFYDRAIVFQSLEHYYIVPISFNAFRSANRLYVKGISVRNGSMWYSFPAKSQSKYELLINVKSDDYDINVARTELTHKSSSELYGEVLQEVCSAIASDEEWDYTEKEREVLRQFSKQFRFER